MLLEDLTSRKAADYVGKIDVLLLPVGTIEAHGPHCSVMADVLVPQKVAQEVEKIMGDKLLLVPIIPYGHSWHLRDRPGSHDVPGNVFAEYVYQVIKGFRSWGIKYVLVLNGHLGNLEMLHEAAERACDAGIKTVVLNWWSGDYMNAIKDVVSETGSHAGETETSMLWVVGDRFVDKASIPTKENAYTFPTAARNDDIFEKEINIAMFPQAYAGRPFDASPEKGKVLMERAVKQIVEVVKALQSGKLLSKAGS